jgi:hypothetical protein
MSDSCRCRDPCRGPRLSRTSGASPPFRCFSPRMGPESDQGCRCFDERLCGEFLLRVRAPPDDPVATVWLSWLGLGLAWPASVSVVVLSPRGARATAPTCRRRPLVAALFCALTFRRLAFRRLAFRRLAARGLLSGSCSGALFAATVLSEGAHPSELTPERTLPRESGEALGADEATTRYHRARECDALFV